MSARNVLVAASLAALVACAAGCPGDEKCRVGSDCLSGVCLSSGECGQRHYPDANEIIVFPDAGIPDAEAPAGDDAAVPPGPDGSVVEADAGAGADAAAPHDASAPGPDGSVQTCSANHDGVITKAEMPVVLGAKATFLVAHDVTVNSAPTQKPDGTLVWDFSGALNGDAEVEFSPTALAGQWFAADFPGSEFTLRLSGTGDTLGVLQCSADALLLAGMASPAASATATDFHYEKDDYSGDPSPVTSVAYPLQTGATWTSNGVIEGDYDGSTYHCDPTLLSCTPYPNCCIRHVYTSTVDKAGQVVTPLGTFDALRIKNVVEFEMLLYGLWTNVKTVRSYVFVSECFGTVASIAAQDGETEEEFTTASEVRRLTP